MPMKGASRAPFDQPSCQAATVDHQIILKERSGSESLSDNLTASFHFRLLPPVHQDQEGGDENYGSEKY